MLDVVGDVGGAPLSPNGGQLFTIGPLGVNIGETGLDIAPDGTAYAADTLPRILYTINLVTGEATSLGDIPSEAGDL